MTWYVAHVETGDEARVCERFTAHALESWHHEFIDGYAFVNTSAPELARYTRGVIRLLPFSLTPTPVPEDQMLAVQAQCRAIEAALAEARAKQKGDRVERQIAGMGANMVANLFAKAGFSVRLHGERVELTSEAALSHAATSSPGTGRQHSAHQRRRAARAVAGA